MKKNIAVVGCGHWGKNLVRNFAELDSLEAICDPNKNLAESLSKKYSVKNLSFSEVLMDSKIEGVVLAVPAFLHASMAIEAMNNSKNVFVEKPLAMNKLEAEKMINASKKNNVKLMVGHLLQYHPVFIAVKELVASGKIGKLNYLYSNRLSPGKIRSEEDVIWSFAPHDISMVLSIIGKEPKSVRTDSSCILQKNITDIATIHLFFDNGLKSHIAVSWLHPNKEQKLVVIGEKASIVFDDTKIWNEKLEIFPHVIQKINGELSLIKSSSEHIIVPESEPLRNECKHFIDIVNSQTLPITDANEGLNVLKILSAASLSVDKKKAYSLDLL